MVGDPQDTTTMNHRAATHPSRRCSMKTMNLKQLADLMLQIHYQEELLTNMRLHGGDHEQVHVYELSVQAYQQQIQRLHVLRP